MWFLKPPISQIEALEADEDNARQSPQLSETEIAELQRLRGEVESLTGQKDRLQEEINSRDADREIYWGLLIAALKEGLELRESNPSREDAQQWASRLYKLLEDAEGEWRVKPFRRPTPGYAYADLDATGEQAFMDYQLSKLQDLVQLVHSRQIIKFRSSFDPHEWADWKSPPQVASETRDELQESERLSAENEKLKTENQKLRQYESRWLLKLALNDAREEGLRLKNSDPSVRTNVEQWARRICEMLKDALPFYGNSLESRKRHASKRHSGGSGGRNDVDAYEEEVLNLTLQRVEEVIRLLDSRDCPDLEPDFNGKEWVNER